MCNFLFWPGHPVLFPTDQSRAGAHSANEGSENWLLLNLLTVICFQALLLSLAGGRGRQSLCVIYFFRFFFSLSNKYVT